MRRTRSTNKWMLMNENKNAYLLSDLMNQLPYKESATISLERKNICDEKTTTTLDVNFVFSAEEKIKISKKSQMALYYLP